MTCFLLVKRDSFQLNNMSRREFNTWVKAMVKSRHKFNESPPHEKSDGYAFLVAYFTLILQQSSWIESFCFETNAFFKSLV